MQSNKNQEIILLCTTPNKSIAKKIVKILLKKRLIACANLVKNIKSYYIWNNKLQKDKEILMIMKSKKSLFDKINNKILKFHPYETPEIISLNLQDIDKNYKIWLNENLISE
ncbi:divalent-cation tolerance protein CutA [Campylobacter sp. FMV-PI01]|uniref:Divalent-cation tolerance protein CutA n=1 Tax=Campylobacter portucalensis TaxID=2608384 RepID=A0A6L5WKS4_9BACT|nr:divalent-cation tolerance protein CutA [Campylobacter portucalensis]MSN96595.1 divalent-cation tolerance protein CutA [Campylobacter portucalensis]